MTSEDRTHAGEAGAAKLWTQDQLSIALQDAAHNARAIQELSVGMLFAQNERPEEVEPMRQAIHSMAKLIGFVLDNAMANIAGAAGPAHGSRPEDWDILPDARPQPVAAARSGEVAHHG